MWVRIPPADLLQRRSDDRPRCNKPSTAAEVVPSCPVFQRTAEKARRRSGASVLRRARAAVQPEALRREQEENHNRRRRKGHLRPERRQYSRLRVYAGGAGLEATARTRSCCDQ